jgi:tetratricopeptide (TPR) repeat protein
MRIAVLPFNAGPGAKPAFGRQLANFLVDTVRSATDAELNAVNYLAQIEQDGQPKAAFVNVADTLVEYDFIQPLFEQAEAQKVMDGVVRQEGDNYEVVVRFHEAGNPQPIAEKTFHFKPAEVFGPLNEMIRDLADQAGKTLPEAMQGGLDFGTDSGLAFIDFLEGYDGFQYMQAANGQVANEFDPELAFTALRKSMQADPDFLAPYEVSVAFARMCGQFRIGTFEKVEHALLKAAEVAPDDFRAHYGLGELYQQGNLGNKAADSYEKALELHEKKKAEYETDGRGEEWQLEQASIISRIGVAQMSLGMPVNAERNFRRAIELEANDKPSLNLLAGVLQSTNRGHEIPGLWKEQLDRDPQNGETHAKYAIALYQAEQLPEAEKAFESALSTLEAEDQKLVVKRYYAPMLVQREEYDRAMDFYEDVIDEHPADVQVLYEYAQTLRQANREFEVPTVLDQILAQNPDPNMRAEVLAWKTEITEPKRAEAVARADEKLTNGDFAGAIKELKPLRNWLADYWKLWAVLASSHNRIGEHEEARECAERLINLFPGCEPAYVELMAALNALGRNDDAYNVMRFAAGQMPQSLGIHVNLVLAANRAGHKDEAKNLAQQIRDAVGPNEELDKVFAELEQ